MPSHTPTISPVLKSSSLTVSPSPRLPVSKSLVLLLTFCGLLTSCANQGTLTGGPKDETPPNIISSIPANYTTHFTSPTIELTFNEYFALKDITKQLVVSPPMAKKPEFKVKGKTLEIVFKDTLLPDRTYAINFGDALVDLNEGNPIKNFQYVFSTGSTIDSLQASGKVVDAVDGKPMDDILVMLYSGTADSMPIKTIPLYICRTNKEGKFTLKNLAGGSYKIFALKDGNTNYMFDMPAEVVGFQDSLITPSIANNPLWDTMPVRDTVAFGKDSLTAEGDTVGKSGEIADKRSEKETKKTIKDKAKEAISARQEAMKAREEEANGGKNGIKSGKKLFASSKDSLNHIKDSIAAAIKKQQYLYYPDSLVIRAFTEVKPNQYLAGADRLRRDQIRVKMNERTDSLGFDFLDLPADSVAVSLEWYGEADTLDFWVLNQGMAAHDSIMAILTFPGYDSLERRLWKTDTVKLKARAPVKATGKEKKEFTVSASVESSKSLEFGAPIIFNASLPFIRIDTTRIKITVGKDSLPRQLSFKLFQDTLKGLVLNGKEIDQVHPRILKLTAGFTADTTYRLLVLPGAFTSLNGLKSDSISVQFKMKNKDQYGAVKLALPDLDGPAIVDLLDSRGKPAATRRMSGAGTAVFDLVAPGKYTARLTFDTNNNGKWDTGRYIKHIQPEKTITFGKEMNIKANWEVSETWKW